MEVVVSNAVTGEVMASVSLLRSSTVGRVQQRLSKILAVSPYEMRLMHSAKILEAREHLARFAVGDTAHLSFARVAPERVQVHDRLGTVKFRGTGFDGAGEVVGVQLDDAVGHCDGSVAGRSYFHCPRHTGIFVHADEVKPRLDDTLVDVPQKRILFRGIRGTIRFHGPTQFSPRMWFGIELDEPMGNCDGTAMGVRYFYSRENHGLFVCAMKLGREVDVARRPRDRSHGTRGK